jgi:hypothetical protein
MNRGASAAVQAEWAKAANEPALLLEARFDAADGGTVYLTDSYRAVVWGGNTYAAGGHMLGFTGLTESAELRITDVTVELSGVDQTWVSIILAKQYLDRRLLIYKMFFDQASGALMVDPFAIHDGRMDEPRSDEDPQPGKHTISVKSRDQFADFERRNGRHTNPNDQRALFPGDGCFDLVAQLAGQQVQLVWGAVRP